MPKRKGNDENNLTEKGSKRGIGGRPRLQDQATLTPEMEEIAQLVFEGFSPGEIAEKLRVDSIKVLTLLQESVVLQARIKNKFGDKRELWTKMRYELFETIITMMTKLIKEGKVPWKYLYDMKSDFDSEYKFFQKVQEVKKITMSEESEGGKQLTSGDYDTPEQPLDSIFKTKKQTTLEHSRKGE